MWRQQYITVVHDMLLHQETREYLSTIRTGHDEECWNNPKWGRSYTSAVRRARFAISHSVGIADIPNEFTSYRQMNMLKPVLGNKTSHFLYLCFM